MWPVVHEPSHAPRYPLVRRTIKHREIHVVPRNLEKRARAITRRVNELVLPLLADGVHGYRPQHSIHTAIDHIGRLSGARIALDLKSFFASIDKQRLKRQVDRLDPTLWREVDPFLGRQGLRTGPNFSPMLSNLYLHELDHRFGWVRYCDNIMIVADEPERVFARARRHLADLGLECHEVTFDPEIFLGQRVKGGARSRIDVGVGVSHPDTE